jgi:hypothetical protein
MTRRCTTSGWPCVRATVCPRWMCMSRSDGHCHQGHRVGPGHQAKFNTAAKSVQQKTTDEFSRMKIKTDQSCYKILSLRDIRTAMIQKGWILPSDPSPFEEEASASESEEASASENEE